jgi:hypothetical protein
MQCLETYRSFNTVYEQETRVLDNLQRHVERLEPVSNDTNKLRQMGKNVTVNKKKHFSKFFFFRTKTKTKFRNFLMKFFLVHNQLNI